MRGVWLFPPTYILHLAEEYLVAGGFTVWAERALGLSLTDAEFIVWNAAAFGLMCVGATLVSAAGRFRFVEIALSIAVLGNVAAHAIGSVATWTYSPGLITGLAVWLPLGIVRLRDAQHAVTRKGRIAGWWLGIAVVLVTLAVLALGRADGHQGARL